MVLAVVAGSFAIQLASFAGAEVTAVDNASKLEMMSNLGATHVIDYKIFIRKNCGCVS